MPCRVMRQYIAVNELIQSVQHLTGLVRMLKIHFGATLRTWLLCKPTVVSIIIYRMLADPLANSALDI